MKSVSTRQQLTPGWLETTPTTARLGKPLLLLQELDLHVRTLYNQMVHAWITKCGFAVQVSVRVL